MSRSQHYRIRYILSDGIAMGLSLLLFNAIRFHIEEAFSYWDSLGSYLLNARNIFISLAVWLSWMAIFALSGYYNKPLNKSRLDELWITLCSVFIGSVLSFLFWVIDDWVFNPKVYLELFGVAISLAFCPVYAGRLGITLWGQRQRNNPQYWDRVLLVGTRREVDRLAQYDRTMRFVVQGHLYLDEEIASCEKTLDERFKQMQPTAIFLTVSAEKKSLAGLLLYSMYQYRCPIYIEADSVPLSQPRPKLRQTLLMGVPMIEVTETNMGECSKTIKWCFDRLTSFLALLILSPIYLIIAYAVRRSSPGSIFYRQERIGRRGKPFWIYKFRTMYTDSEGDAPKLSYDGDPRITPVGRWLRRYRLDELPQFYNVLRGDMSFVGPRPERQYYIERLVEHAPYYYLLHNVLPGITSWGMVRYGYASTEEEMLERLRYDWLYYENMSLKLDITILFYTIRTIWKGEGK